MLLELHVKNLAVLASASVELGDGLNVLTGETGAGKSIVVDSLILLSGARASSELIRTGADTLTVTGVFRPRGEGWRRVLTEAGVEPAGDEVLIRREISHSGRNRVLIDDQPATARLLADLAPWLLRIHGQREELGLVDPELQRVWLDESGGAEARERLAETARRWEAWQTLETRLKRLSGRRREIEERIDLLRFQASEIDAANLTAGEEDELRSERNVLRNREQIVRALGGSFELLHEDDGAAIERVARSTALLDEVVEWEPQAQGWKEELEELRIRLDELAAGLRDRLDGLEADPGRLNEVEERLAAVERLMKKHGGSTAAVLERREAIGRELDELSGDIEDRSDLEEKAAAARATYREAAVALSAAREGWGERLTDRIRGELEELGLGKARLSVALEEQEAGPHGVDQVVFLFAPNPGEEPRPLAKIASGGELSRIYLGLQLAVQALEERGGEEPAAPALIFDEVDTGISGAQAAALGRKLQRLAAGAQILAVTHLPQVASFADTHFRVVKEVRSGRTHTDVQALDDEERVEEVARLLAGDKVTEHAAANAREMIAGSARSGSARSGSAKSGPRSPA